ncbi:DUF559 domain-containing protein [Herbiconiux sp. L3-i23]|uniref:DUF559 domain-containing protein n=1 Tax=Herbiconiux sp. L3-i23 TaxID=2905871 RepID=UPI002073AD93|nr:DUF559 domain-containing protein [Herbiconiux sp. L3-i23]
MEDVNRFIEDRGALAATYELHRFGMGRADIADAVRAGAITRIRQGWYGNPWLEPSAQQAARVGGQLTCSSGAEFWGLWLPRHARSLHVGLDPHTARLRTRTSYRTRLDPRDSTVDLHWTGVDTSRSRVVAPPLECLAQIARCHPSEFALVAAESALHHGFISEEEWERTVASSPGRVRKALPRAGSLSGSGIESLFVTRMRRLGLAVRQQVFINGVGYVDAVIGDSLVVELDGQAYHRDDARDRRRDAVSSIQGYRVLRFLAKQVTDDWELVQSAVLAAVARGDHLHPPHRPPR